jgi:hypothetical protein
MQPTSQDIRLVKHVFGNAIVTKITVFKRDDKGTNVENYIRRESVFF